MSIQSDLIAFVVRRPRLRRALTALATSDRDERVALFGTVLHINARKEHGYLRASRRLAGSHSLVLNSELPVMINLCLLMEDGDTFIDVGANVGLYSCTIGRRLRLRPGRNRVYAFEPNPDTFERLKRATAPLGVIAIQKGVTDRACTLEFVGGAVSNVFTATEHAKAYNIKSERQRIDCIRLDEAGIEGDGFIIKIDVEGQELKVLRGAEGLFASGKVKAVYVDGFDDSGVVDFLRDKGMTFFSGVSLEPIATGFNLLALPRSSVSAA